MNWNSNIEFVNVNSNIVYALLRVENVAHTQSCLLQKQRYNTIKYTGIRSFIRQKCIHIQRYYSCLDNDAALDNGFIAAYAPLSVITLRCFVNMFFTISDKQFLYFIYIL